MTKELTPLEALERLKGYTYADNWDCDTFHLLKKECKEELSIIEKALKEYEEYEKQDIKVCGGSFLTCKSDFETLWKEHEALEIIKRHLFLQYSDNLCVYILCQWIDKNSWRIIQTLTQEEYDLLKEVLV